MEKHENQAPLFMMEYHQSLSQKPRKRHSLINFGVILFRHVDKPKLHKEN